MLATRLSVALGFLLVLVLACDGCAVSSASGPSPGTVRTEKLPTYSEVVASYPEGVSRTFTEADIVGRKGDQLLVKGQVEWVMTKSGRFESRAFEYGTKLTVRRRIVINGVTYHPGDRLTVDAQKGIIKVSSWE